MGYLKHTRKLISPLEAVKCMIPKWFIDAVYAVHYDMKGQTGGGMSLGKGLIYNQSTKQKINTKSSTVCEVIACWSRWSITSSIMD